ncbi:hypothetical protein CP556_10765 [Natrinema sp. CBA1119]|nr:hypothetical protein CP556_10765 [Natrinema sp. CBA1119]
MNVRITRLEGRRYQTNVGKNLSNGEFWAGIRPSRAVLSFGYPGCVGELERRGEPHQRASGRRSSVEF